MGEARNANGSLAMNCEQAREYWHHWMDGKTIDHAALDGHLAVCPSCQHYCDEMRMLAGLLDELRKETESIASRRESGAQSSESTPTRWLSRLGRIAATAAVVAITATVWIKVTENRPPSSVTKPEPISALTTALDDHEILGLTLHGNSAERFMAVAQPSTQPHVQVFRLYEAWRRPSSREPS